MAEKMYHVEGVCPDNETLARRLQAGDVHAAALLLSQNEDYLTRLASELCASYDVPSLIEDLKQEGAVALIDAVGRFDAVSGAKLLTFSTPAIRSAMLDHLAEASLPVCLPPNRYHRLRRVAYLVITQEGSASEEDLHRSVCNELGVRGKWRGNCWRNIGCCSDMYLSTMMHSLFRAEEIPHRSMTAI